MGEQGVAQWRCMRTARDGRVGVRGARQPIGGHAPPGGVPHASPTGATVCSAILEVAGTVNWRAPPLPGQHMGPGAVPHSSPLQAPARTCILRAVQSAFCLRQQASPPPHACAPFGELAQTARCTLVQSHILLPPVSVPGSTYCPRQPPSRCSIALSLSLSLYTHTPPHTHTHYTPPPSPL